MITAFTGTYISITRYTKDILYDIYLNIINSGHDHSLARKIFYIMKILHQSEFILKIVALYIQIIT